MLVGKPPVDVSSVRRFLLRKVPTETQTTTAPTGFPPPAPLQQCSDVGTWLNPEPECRKLQCPDIFLPGGKYKLTAKLGQSVFFGNEEESTAKLWCHPGYVLTHYTEANKDDKYGGRIPEDFEVNILVSQQICRERLERDWEVSQYILGRFLDDCSVSVDTVQ